MTVDGALNIARIALAFGEVNRTTAHPDGRPETDTTHTVMLALLVAHLARDEGLDAGLSSNFAMVHDLVETYALDTCTARELSPEACADKERRENAALERLRRDFGENSWVISMIDRYMQQVEPEARLVRYADKITPKLTHILNRGLALQTIGMTVEEMAEKHLAQGKQLELQYPELTATRALFKESALRAESDAQPRMHAERWKRQRLNLRPPMHEFEIWLNGNAGRTVKILAVDPLDAARFFWTQDMIGLKQIFYVWVNPLDGTENMPLLVQVTPTGETSYSRALSRQQIRIIDDA